MASTFKLIALAIVAILAMVAASFARDLAYQVNALIVLAVSVGMFLWLLRGVGEAVRTSGRQELAGGIR